MTQLKTYRRDSLHMFWCVLAHTAPRRACTGALLGMKKSDVLSQPHTLLSQLSRDAWLPSQDRASFGGLAT